MLKQRWCEEEESEKGMAAQAFSLNRQRNQDLISHNEAERQLKLEAGAADRQRDKDMLAIALDREAAIA